MLRSHYKRLREEIDPADKISKGGGVVYTQGFKGIPLCILHDMSPNKVMFLKPNLTSIYTYSVITFYICIHVFIKKAKPRDRNV